MYHIAPDERPLVIQWIRNALPMGDDWSAAWRRQAYGSLLIELAGEQIDDETYLRICRETGRLGDLVTRLLERGRIDEAVKEARAAGITELLGLATIFIAHNQAAQADRFVVERAQNEPDNRLTIWLKDRARVRGDLQHASQLAETLFWERPTLAGYTEVKELAAELRRWDELRPTLLARLAEEGQFALLTEIYLAENEVDQALQTLQQIGTRAVGGYAFASMYYSEPLKPRVAQAAEAQRPRDALKLYLEMVNQLIDARGRDNYVTAASYLVRVRELYRRLSEEERWELFIADLREQHRRLRALQEELNQAGL
jgi:uncharacterized Zn finger protein